MRTAAVTADMGLVQELLDIVFPPRCPVCARFLWHDPRWEQTRTLGFCQECFSDFHPITSPRCPRCGRPFLSGPEEDHICGACLLNEPHYDRAVAPYRYEGSLMEAIHRFKYGQKGFMGDLLGPLLAQFALRELGRLKKAVVMAVPLHPRRLRERGFNQSAVLARHVARGLEAHLDIRSLRRVKYTRPQTGLGQKERLKNVKSGFTLTSEGAVKDRTVVLVDDVATTGGTLNECARVLKKNGCEAVICLTLAMTPNL